MKPGSVLTMLLLLAALCRGTGPGDEQPLPNFTGIARGADGKVLLLEQADQNTMQFACTRKTHYFDGTKRIKPSAIHAGDQVSVEARLGPDGKPEAVNVRLIARRKPH
jgi:hypothetical protein